jgi:nucleoside-diphosphate-sugar epimerase
MPPKIFLTGSTGYIGGSVLHTIVTTHPEYNITVLLRRVPDNFTTSYPNITIVEGDYDSTPLLTSHAAASDIVIHCGDSDHEPSLNALLAGLLQRATPGYLLHLSGSGIVSDWNSTTHLGCLNPKTWSDISSLDEIANLPSGELHRSTESMLHHHMSSPSSNSKINIAILCPPDIYGPGTGPGKTSSALLPMYVAEILKSPQKRAFYVCEGTNTRSWVHINDLTSLYLHVVEAAASPSTHPPEKFFNRNGYYFAGTQEHSHIALATQVGRVLAEHGVIESAEPVEIGLEEVDRMARIWEKFPKLGRYLFAANSRTRAERAGGLWGYKGSEEGLMECVEGDVLAAVRGKVG